MQSEVTALTESAYVSLMGSLRRFGKIPWSDPYSSDIFMSLFLGVNLINILNSLVLLGLACHLKMCLSL